MFLDLTRRRRSIRKFTPQPVTEKQQRQLAEVMLRCPTGKGRRPWQFVFVQQPETLQRLASARPQGSALLGRATLAVAIVCDPQESDTWIEDCAIAAVSAQYAAADMGLGSCWVQIRGREHDATTSAAEFVRRELQIPAQYEVLCLVAFGEPAEEKSGAPAAALKWPILRNETFDTPLNLQPGEEHGNL